MVKIYVQHRIISKNKLHCDSLSENVWFVCLFYVPVPTGSQKKKIMDKKGDLSGKRVTPWNKAILSTVICGTCKRYIRHTAIQNSQTSSACVQRNTKRHQLLLWIIYILFPILFHFKRFSFVCVLTHMSAGTLRGKGQIPPEPEL